MGAFHAYDIRGLYGSEITPRLAYGVGRLFVDLVKAKTVLVAYDARLHSKELYDQVIEGLLDGGADVTALGLSSTPQAHFFQIKLACSAGIMVTASHNPKEYHGFKFFDGHGGSVSYAKGLDRMEAALPSVDTLEKKKRGALASGPAIDAYIDFLAGFAAGKKFSSKIVIDAASGSSGPVFQAIAKKLGLNAVFLNSEPDGNFPNHDPNPLKDESRVQISKAVKDEKADFGIIMDGDGDRIIFVDEKGQAIENYFVSALIAQALLEKNPGQAVVYDLISSKALPAHISECGGRPVVSRVGYTFLYDKMVETGAIFGAETSGHVYFKVDTSYYTESAAYALVVMLKLLSVAKKPLSGLVAPLMGKYYQAKELNVKAHDKAKALALIEEKYGKGKISKLDGVSVDFPDVWFNVRPSNTEPFLRVRLEAVDKTTAESTLAEIGRLLEGV